jgi:hypothetical protein
MFEEYEKKKKKQVTLMRSMMDFGMGVLVILAGLFFLFHERLNVSFGDNSTSLFEKFFGGVCILYGAWRVYRGYKKNYFK